MKQIWFTKKIRYDPELGYVMLQLPPVQLPPLEYEGISFEPKPELHCSLLCTQKLAESFANSELANELLAAFVETFVKNNTIKFTGFANKAYICEDAGAKSIVIGANVLGVTELFQALRGYFSQLSQLPPPVLHVTLYKYNHRYGIGIHNKTQLRQLCQPMPPSVLPTEVKERM